MSLIKINNRIIDGSANRPILVDIVYHSNNLPKPVIIFSHGFKGYKDWGAFNNMASFFAEAGYVFVKFNFSFNGGTAEDVIDFPDLEAFGHNNYSIELDDLGLVIDAVVSSHLIPEEEKDLFQINLLGHSRGGGISILKAAEDERISKLATLSAVGDFAQRFPGGEHLDEWRNTGVQYIMNSRTHQNMPLYFQFYEDFSAHKNRLDIPAAIKRLKMPVLIVHGENDETVSVEDAKKLHAACLTSELFVVHGANHTFGMKQPWTADAFPPPFFQALEKINSFLRTS